MVNFNYTSYKEEQEATDDNYDKEIRLYRLARERAEEAVDRADEKTKWADQ